jgi:DNA-binding transcriptional ArsR family regulator
MPADLARVAQTVGDPTRLRMLVLLLEARPLVAKELAFGAGVEPATATAHLQRLERDGLVRVARRGRYKVVTLASPAAARLVEALLALSAPPAVAAGDPLRAARFCYDHLAGELGMALTDRLVARGVLGLRRDRFVLGAAAESWLRRVGVDVAAVRGSRRLVAPRCLDWSERRDHVAGALGAAVAARLVALGWVARREGTRAVRVTAAGRRGLRGGAWLGARARW